MNPKVKRDTKLLMSSIKATSEGVWNKVKKEANQRADRDLIRDEMMIIQADLHRNMSQTSMLKNKDTSIHISISILMKLNLRKQLRNCC